MFQTVGNRNGVERKKIRMEEGEESREETCWDREERKVELDRGRNTYVD